MTDDPKSRARPQPMLDVVIWGRPHGKRPPRGSGRYTTMDPDTRAWIESAAAVIGSAWRHETLTGPMSVHLDVVHKRPQRMRGHDRVWRPAKPDGDNIEKATWDAMVRAGVMRDDAQIVNWGGSKWYGRQGEREHLRVIVCDLTP